VIDGLNLVAGDMQVVVAGAKALARTISAPVLATCALEPVPHYRVADIRRRNRTFSPGLTDLNSSIAAESDMVLLLQESLEDRDVVQISVGKHRDGPKGVTQVVFIRQLSSFFNLAPETSRDVRKWP